VQLPRLPLGRERSTGPKVGVVLGAGGITGIAWLAGAVRAIREQTGWDPATADVITGTSAGAVVATVLAAGQDPCDLLIHAEEPAAHEHAVALATAGRPAERLPLPLPGSLSLALGGLVTRDLRHRRASLAGWLPRGVRSADEIRGLTHEAALAGWPQDRELWLHTCDMRSGRLVTFGREGAPDAPLADAVVASCAVPSYYRPVAIGGRRYIDGGMRSFTNADRLLGEDCDVVLVLSPFATRHRGALLDTALFGVARTATSVRTEREAERLREAGAQVAIVAPAAQDIRAMGLNPMERAHSRHVLETAEASVAARLDGLLADVDLPGERPARRHLRAVA